MWMGSRCGIRCGRSSTPGAKATQWWTHYDPDQLATELTDEQIEAFLDTAEGAGRFADELRAARDREPAIDAPSGRGHLRAL